MARRVRSKSSVNGLGQNFIKILEFSPINMTKLLIENTKTGNDSFLEIPDDLSVENQSQWKALAAFMAKQDPDLLIQLESISTDVNDLGQGKGITSLETTAKKRMSSSLFEVFEAQRDALCRSIWTYVYQPAIFHDAESFHSARRYREHGRLYSAFEVETSVGRNHTANDFDLDAFCQRATEALELRVAPSATALDLPQTDKHPPSVMVALRHGGSLSSIQDHRVDGRSTIYYRPANEAIFIYTPSERKLEVCSDSFSVRNETSKVFAEVLLGQDLSTKPLSKRNYNLARFRDSLSLPLPDFDDVEITFANVFELQMRLGSWSRVLTLKVAKEEDIGGIADRFIGAGRKAAAQYGYSKISIAVGYVFRDDKSAGVLNVSATSSNASNVMNATNPKLRDLGQRLLECWGILEHFHAFEPKEVAKHYDNLITLYDHSGEEVSGAFMTHNEMDVPRLISASMIEKKGRQDIILIEDDDGGPSEADVSTGDVKGTVRLEGPFGEDMGERTDAELLRYVIRRKWLSETVLKALQHELGSRHAKIVEDHVAEFGTVDIADNSVPVYLVRCLENSDVLQKLDIWFRRRQENGYGIVLSSSDLDQQYLGPNVVIPLRSVLDRQEDQITLNPEALDLAFVSGRFLAEGGDKPQVVRSKNGGATLFLPKKMPVRLAGEKQALMFDRLIQADIAGHKDVRTNSLMAGLGSSSPQQLFRKAQWDSIRDEYICNPVSKSWRLGSLPTGAV